MSFMKHVRNEKCFPATLTALMAIFIALSSQAASTAGTVAVIELVPLSVAGASDTAASLPAPLTQVDPGDLFVVEVWSQTTDSQGLSSVSTTIQFDPTLAIVNSVIHTALFSELANGSVDNAAGFVTNLSGSHLSTCVDQVGVAPVWARVAILQMQAAGPGMLVVDSTDTGSLAFGTAICGVGDLLPVQVAYGAATLTVTNQGIPTVSQWGLMILALLVLSAGTISISRVRRLSS